MLFRGNSENIFEHTCDKLATVMMHICSVFDLEVCVCVCVCVTCVHVFVFVCMRFCVFEMITV